MWLAWILFIIGGYLLGSIPSAYLLVKARKGLDIRKFGSGNVGSTNSARAAGLSTGVMVFLLDVLKGAIPVAVALWALDEQPLAVVTGLAVFLGHLYPVWLNFSGGKGVATAFGVYCVLAPPVALAAIIVWLIISPISGYVSLGSCCAAAATVIAGLITGQPWTTELLLCLICAMILLRHRSNFRHIADHTESKLFRRKA